MYLIATRLGPTDENGIARHSSSQLYDVKTVAERRDLEARYDRVSRITANYAHRWVRDGGVHNTGLYLDEGRIRKAG